jgi:hypothetical protein
LEALYRMIALGILLAPFAANPALADPEGRWHGDIRHFHEHDMDRWHEGHWSNEFHEGRRGWWWVIGPDWYYYPAPVYPYPDPFLPPGVVVEAVPTPGTQYWYYCSNPAGYYPYVAACYHHWRRVASTTVIVQPQSAPPVIQQQVPAVQVPVQRPADNGRERDDRQLNAFAVEMDGIHPNDRHAAERLADLQKRVKNFHNALFQRSYNAMDLLKDTENLETRIADKRAQVPRPAAQKKRAERPKETTGAAPAPAPNAETPTPLPVPAAPPVVNAAPPASPPAPNPAPANEPPPPAAPEH